MGTIIKLCIYLQMIGLFFCSGAALAQTLASRRLGQPQRPSWVESDACLRITGNVDFKSVPLSKAVASLTAQTKVSLTVSPHLKDCRVWICAQERPLSEIMMRIQDLFHHGGPLTEHSCYWLKIEEKGTPATYLLTQSRMGLKEEEENAGVPSQKLAKWLRDVRRYAGVPPEKRQQFKTDFPFLNYFAQKGEPADDEFSGPLSEVVATLTDSEIETLASIGRVDAPNYVFSPSQIDSLIRVAKKSGSYNYQLAQAPTQAYLRFHPIDQSGRYGLSLGFSSGSVSGAPGSFNFDTLDNGQEYDWSRKMLDAMEREEQGTSVELIEAKDRVDDKVPKLSIGAALALWRKATGRNMFCEIFLKPKTTLRVTTGKPETLLTRICVQYGYDWRKVGDTYLVYSKAWGADRASDIPDYLLDKWTAIVKKEGFIPLETALEMADLRDRQLKTMQDYLYINIFWRAANLHALRLLKSLSMPEREAAVKSAGPCILNTNDQYVLGALAAIFGRAADYRGAMLQVDTTKVNSYPAYTVTVTLPSGESERGYVTLSPPQTPKRLE